MAKQAIGLGAVANDGNGDDLRTGGDKINDNFNELYTALGDGTDLNAELEPYTTTEQTKLAGIEAAADVTDTANVTAAGALMDSEVTNLAAVKAFDPMDYATAAQGATADTATQPGDSWATLDGTAWRVAYTNGTGDVTELALGADGTFLKSNGASSAPTFATPAGSGDVSKVGTPANNQVAVWTGDGTLEGITALTYDATNFVISADLDPNADGTINLGNATNRFASISVDSIDLNGTTFTGTTLADPGADAIMGWDDSVNEIVFFSIGSGLTPTGTVISADVQSVAGEVGVITAADLRTAINVEDGADVTDAANVETAIEAITLSAVTGATGDEVLVVDATDGGLKAVLWENLPGASGMTNFSLAGDSGTPQTIADGNTLDIAGGTGIATVAGATDTVTINVTGVLEDLNTLGAPASDGQFIVATGAGAFAYESTTTARTSLGAAALGANVFTGTQDFNGQQVEGAVNKVVTSVTGTLTLADHSGNVLVTSGNVTVPTTAGFNAVIVAGGAHTVSFNSTTSAAMATGDVMTVLVESGTVIHAVLTAAADKVTFS